MDPVFNCIYFLLTILFNHFVFTHRLFHHSCWYWSSWKCVLSSISKQHRSGRITGSYMWSTPTICQQIIQCFFLWEPNTTCYFYGFAKGSMNVSTRLGDGCSGGVFLNWISRLWANASMAPELNGDRLSDNWWSGFPYELYMLAGQEGHELPYSRQLDC